MVIILELVACCLCIVGAHYGARRNAQIGNYFRELVRKTQSAHVDDIKNGRDSSWRWKALNKFPYIWFLMLLCFWRPLDSFVTDKSFAEIQK
ncbi:MAG TPA: hypothetical protein P5056_03455 [Candidatus Paceibacterota bacterium]|nr:hypothetical protein [Candidatus Paceibacterota bacterium]